MKIWRPGVMLAASLAAGFGAVILLCEAVSAQHVRYDLVIRNGRIVDGAGNPWFKGDIGIVGEKIAFVGRRIGDVDAVRTIDASRYVVSPGFYDLHCHSDTALLQDGRNEVKLRQGVTFELIGETESMGPWVGPTLEAKKRELQKQGMTVDWETLGGYLARLQRQGISNNVASMVGTGTLRMDVLDWDNRPPTDGELRRMEALADQAMRDGAAGVMGALVNPPGSFAGTEELIALARVAAKYGGIYSTHVRGENETVVDAIREAVRIGREAAIPTEVVHIKSAGRPNWGLMRQSVRVIEEARAQGVDITAEIYPWTAMHHAMSNAIPNWAQDGGVQRMLERFRNPADRARIKREMEKGGDPGWWNIYKSVDGLDGIIITRAPNQPERYVGRTMADVAKLMGATDPRDAIIDFLAMQNGSVMAMWFAMSEDDVVYGMKQPWVAFDSDGSPGGRGGKAHPRYYGTFPRILGKYVREDHVLTLEDAIRKMTSLAAQKLGHRDRGMLRPGYFADVVLFDPDTVAERATYQNSEQYPVGIDYVVVNGVVVIDQGRHTGATPGKVLYGPGRPDGGSVQ